MTPSRAALANSYAKPERPVRLMQRIYRDVGLAAVARELELSTPDLETEVVEAVKRGARYVYLAPKADRESQALPRQPASAISTDPGSPDARGAAVSVPLLEPASVTRAAPHVKIAPKADRESERNDITGPLQARSRQPASAISPARGAPDASAAAVPAALVGPEPVKRGASYVYRPPKADRESTRNGTEGPSEALPPQPASAIFPWESPDASAAAVSASLLGPEAVKRRAPDLRLAPKAASESGRNDIAGPSEAVRRQPASAISPARGSSDASAAAALASPLGLEPVKRGAPSVFLARKADRESERNDIEGRTKALPRRPSSAIYPAQGSPDASAAAVLASLLGLEPIKRDAPYVYSAPKAEHESTRNDITASPDAIPRQPASAISPAPGSSDVSAVVTRHLNLSPKSDQESRRNDISSPSQKLLPQPAWGLLLRRQPASAISPARGSSDASAAVVARQLNLAPKADRKSGRNDISAPSQPLLRRPDSAVSPGWGLLLRRQPASAVSPARGLPDGRRAAVGVSLLGPSLAGGRAGSSSVRIIRGEVGPILRTGSEEGAEAHEPSIEVTPGRFKRLDKSFWPLLPKN
jgi:hypothetical protein